MGTAYFFHGKYEAKNHGGIPRSEASGTPWVNISFFDSITKCASLGEGYHLITNEEWMTIGANVTNIANNWSEGSVGSGHLYRGHTDNSPGSACAADINDTKAFVEGDDCTSLATGEGENDESTQRRTLSLSNGEIIWDLGANVSEWIDYFNKDDKASDDGTPDTFYREFTALAFPTQSMPLSDLIPTNAVKSFWSGAWNSSVSIGQYFSAANGVGGQMRRGGSWGLAARAGVFATFLSSKPTDEYNSLGFRCSVAAP